MKKINYKDFYFNYLIIIAIIIIILMSYFRFIINNDYIVYYEGECDPYLNSCFIGCDNDDCTEEYYYKRIEKNASDLLEQCGENILVCDQSNFCLDSDRFCSIEYCDSEIQDNECKSFEFGDEQASLLNDSNLN